MQWLWGKEGKARVTKISLREEGGWMELCKAGWAGRQNR